LALPKLQHPTFELKIPSSGNKYLFRPYTVKEQKILLTVKDSEDENEVTDLLNQLISSCCMSKDCNPKKLAYFDIEYIFLKLRAKSVGEVVDLSYKCNNTVNDTPCGTTNSFPINLDKVEVVFDNKDANTFEIQDGLTVKMNYPTLSTMNLVEKYNKTKDLDNLIQAIVNSLDYISDDSGTYDTFTPEEATEFITGLNINSFEKFLTFFISLPKIKEKIEFKCSKCGYSDDIWVSGLLDFFV